MHEVTSGRVLLSLLSSPLLSSHPPYGKPTCDIRHPGNEIIRWAEGRNNVRKKERRLGCGGGGGEKKDQSDYFSDFGITKIRGRASAGENKEGRSSEREGADWKHPWGRKGGEGGKKDALGDQGEKSHVLQNMKAEEKEEDEKCLSLVKSPQTQKAEVKDSDLKPKKNRCRLANGLVIGFMTTD